MGHYSGSIRLNDLFFVHGETVFRESEPACELLENEKGRTAFSQRRNHGPRHLNIVMPIAAIEIGELQRCRTRKNDVGETSGFGKEEFVHGDEKIFTGQSRQDFSRIGRNDRRVRQIYVKRLHGRVHPVR